MRLSLPSGTLATLVEARAIAAASEVPSSSGLMGHLAMLRVPGVLTLRRGEGEVDLDDLPLAELHVLRVALVQLGAVDEPPLRLPCFNCEEEVSVAPSAEVELAPFRDGELDDPELDEPFDFASAHPLPPVRVGRALARSVRLSPRTVGEAGALLRRDPEAPLDLTPAVVSAMGVTALGKERRASALAKALAGASPEAWDALCERWERAHGHARLVAAARCPSCGARNDVPAPAQRELSGPPGEGVRRASSASFPDGDALERLVRRHADELYARRRIRNVDLIVDEGVPEVDDGGEPLLGCYTPPHVDPELGIDRPPEIRLFARSFRAEVELDPTFDLEGEIRETIDHELEHHENFLRGEDPLDDEERAAIAQDRRRLVGRRESVRRGLRAVADDAVGFLRVGWPLLLLGAFATWWSSCR